MLLWTICVTSSESLAAPKGFGSKPNSGSNVGKSKTKKRSSTLETLIKEDQHAKAPKLDKWGLPLPTLEDIFPPLTDDIERRPAKQNGDYSIDEIQSALRGYMDLDLSRALRSNCKISLVHESPPVLVVEDFLTEEECRQVQDVAGLGTAQAPNASSLSPIKVQSATMSQSLAQSVRTSTSWFCHYASVSTLLVKMEELLGIRLSNIEEPQIVQYQASQEFSWHYDHLPPDQLSNGGQRIATVLVYLNDCPESPTVFRDLLSKNGALSVRPVAGRALIFFPADASGVPDERTLHCGKPAVTTEKHLVQCWIHQSPYTATLPPGNRQSDINRTSVRHALGYD